MKASKIKPTDKILQFLKSKCFTPLSILETPIASVEELKKIEIDFNKDILEVGSFRLTKSSSILSGTYFKIDIINPDLDLDGKKTIDNKSLLGYLQGEFRRQNTIIKAKDLRDFNVNTKRSEIHIGNFKLTESLVGGINSLLAGKVEKSYDLMLADKRFGVDNKIINSRITFKEVQRIINKFKITLKDYEDNGEVAINKLLESYLQEHFENASRSGGAKKAFYDLIVGDPENDQGFAIEMKLASSIVNNAGQRQRASGQVKEYVKNLKNKNLIVLIIGPKQDYSSKNIKALEEEVESDYNCYFIYHNVL
jgi:hypothetical protein